MNYSDPDLTVHPPRSPRVRLGGIAILPRALDKCRATLAAKNGEYHYNCPLDQRCFSFLGIDADALKAVVATGKSDQEILEWVLSNSTTKPSEWEIEQWTIWQAGRGPTDVESREYFNGLHKGISTKREDINNWTDLLDMDDYATFGGKP
jgi:hypothetical protein